MATTNTPRSAGTDVDPLEWIRSWRNVWQGVPTNLVQPILPGWTFNINSNNSTSPQTEAAVTAQHSYGRQIGRMSDALQALIERLEQDPSSDDRFTDFLAMKSQIDELKVKAASQRIEQITSDLALLKSLNKELHAQLRAALMEVVK